MDEAPPPCCRICLEESRNSKGLLHPCGCKGTVAGVHSTCLLTWMNSTGSDRCELCGMRYRVQTSRSTPRHRTMVASCLRMPGVCYAFCLVISLGLLLTWLYILFDCFLGDNDTTLVVVKALCIITPACTPIMFGALGFFLFVFIKEIKYQWREALRTNPVTSIRPLGEAETVV